MLSRGGTCDFPKGLEIEKMIQDIVLISNDTKGRTFMNRTAAFNIYTKLQYEEGPYSAETRRVRNRLGLMYHKGSEHIAIDRDEAKAMYTRSIECELNRGESIIHTQRINAMCNLAVWYGQQRNNEESVKESVKLFTSAIEKFDSIPRNVASEDVNYLENHSTSMNNLAMLMEIGEVVEKDVAKAKELYLRSVEIDENPIAMYNLALLLKCEDPTFQDLEESERLFSTVADLGVDLKSLPVLNAQLETARRLFLKEISPVFSFDIDEIDDCLAFVKIADRTR